MYPQQVGEDHLLDLKERLLDDLDAASASALVAQLELRELWAHAPLDHAPYRLDRTLQLAAVGGDEPHLGEPIHDAHPVLPLVSPQVVEDQHGTLASGHWPIRLDELVLQVAHEGHEVFLV